VTQSAAASLPYNLFAPVSTAQCINAPAGFSFKSFKASFVSPADVYQFYLTGVNCPSTENPIVVSLPDGGSTSSCTNVIGSQVFFNN